MYSVEKPLSAMAEVIQAWKQADGLMRSRIELAMLAVDRALQENPFRCSESREADARILMNSPLVVLFSVDVIEQTVRFIRAWIYQRQTTE